MKCARRRKKSRDGSFNRVPYISGSDYPDELHVLLKNEVMIRRLKKNVMDQLPPLRYCAAALRLDICMHPRLTTFLIFDVGFANSMLYIGPHWTLFYSCIGHNPNFSRRTVVRVAADMEDLKATLKAGQCQ